MNKYTKASKGLSYKKSNKLLAIDGLLALRIKSSILIGNTVTYHNGDKLVKSNPNPKT
jgi:hypothetical protein